MINMKSNLIYRPWPELFNELSQAQDTFYAVIDAKVKPHLPDWMKSSKTIFWIQHPEEEKNLQVFESAIQFFLEKGITRSSTLVAIGGGASSDLAGFVAATLLRGISWISVPTTLLAMVDASIGGKVGLNLPQGKNLVGAFHAPQAVYICHEFLSTLPEQEMQSGKGEILKYGFLSPQIHHQILNQEKLELIAFECAELKKKIVEKDFREKGERILLNLGHTLGHAFESALKIPHGIAVAMGIRYLHEVFLNQSVLQEWNKMVQALGLESASLVLAHYPHFSKVQFMKYLEQDKKRASDRIRIILVKECGDCWIQEMTYQEFINKIGQHEDFQR